MDFINKILDWFKTMFASINSWMISTIKFDQNMLKLYNRFISPLSEWIKIVGLIGLIIIIVFGLIALIKKAYKLVIVLLIIFGVLALITWL